MSHEDAILLMALVFFIGLWILAVDNHFKLKDVKEALQKDVVSRAAYDQCEWERFQALMQLKAIGKSLDEKMDDVRPVVRGKWVYDIEPDMFRCSECNGFATRNDYPFCHWCGADMRGAGDV